MNRLNPNTVLLFIGAIAVFAPDVASVAAWLAGVGVPWLATVARVLGAVALLLSSLPRIIGRLRPALALLGLATPTTDAKPDERKPDSGIASLLFLLAFAGAAAVIAHGVGR